ncbi:MAG TPA: hypothetical protein PK308_00245 [Phycisphaerales bacterium]|nr:hypothetical protein [Phycisphaerales bacterium]
MPDVRKMYQKDYIYAYDLEGKDVTVTIERVTAGELTGEGGKKSKKPVLYFKGSKKGLGLCITNARVIAGLYGGFDSDKWIGKKITLYPTTTKFGSDTVECIRIRNRVPAEQAKALRDDVPAPAGAKTDETDLQLDQEMAGDARD